MDFRRAVAALELRARLRDFLRCCLMGLFFGLVVGALVAAIAGTIPLPLPALILAGIAAGVGIMAGSVVSFVRRVDKRRLLIRADSALGSHELSSTALELLTSSRSNFFSASVIEDAARFLKEAGPDRILGRPRLPFLPFIPLLIAAVVLASVFPVNVSKLFSSRHQSGEELALLGGELEGYGRRLEEAARARNLQRSLALSQELERFGRELADSGVRTDDALDRLSDLERRLAREYDLQARARAGKEGGGSLQDFFNGQGSPGELKDLGDALKMLREKTRKAFPQGRPEGGDGKEPTSPDGESSAQQQPKGGKAQGLREPPSPGYTGKTPGSPGGKGTGKEPEESAPGGGGTTDNQAGNGPSSAAGTVPAPVKKGPRSEIVRSDSGEPLAADAKRSGGDSARLLARALPRWTGSKLPEGSILREYERQAEIAIAREEVPPKLKEYVKNYFTIIGMGEKGE